MKKIYILGAGGFAKEVFLLIHDINKHSPSFEFSGFVDANPSIQKIQISDKEYDIFEQELFLEKYAQQADSICLAIGIGNPAIIEKLSKKFSHFDFPNLFHPKSHFVSEFNTIGKGNIITSGCVFTLGIKIGSLNVFNLNTTVGHDSNISDGNVINPGCNLSGGICIGSYNLVGTGATVLQNLKIGSNSILGAGAVLVTDIGDRQMALGVPAKVVKNL